LIPGRVQLSLPFSSGACVHLSVCSAGAHSSSVFALGGDPLFGQIVKAGEPVVSAIVNTIFYGKAPTLTKALCLPIIVGGVGFASLKKGADGAYGLKFDQTALVFGMIANAFAAFKGSENKKLMDAPGIKDRFAGVGNQFAVTEVLAFLVSLPVMLWTEGENLAKFIELLKTSSALQFHLGMSGLTFYLYNEVERTHAPQPSASTDIHRVMRSCADISQFVLSLCPLSLALACHDDGQAHRTRDIVSRQHGEARDCHGLHGRRHRQGPDGGAKDRRGCRDRRCAPLLGH